jgi:hypothetical protein
MQQMPFNRRHGVDEVFALTDLPSPIPLHEPKRGEPVDRRNKEAAVIAEHRGGNQCNK